MTPVRDIPINEARRLFTYDATTGILAYKRSSGKRKCGDIAGTVGRHGYRLVCIDSRQYLAHRVIWAMAYDEQPPVVLDHINRNKDDNRISNLREATTSHNAANCGLRSHNSSGFRGVHFCKQTKRWRADITIMGKVKNLGRYRTPTDAHLAWFFAASRVHGEFIGAAGEQIIGRLKK